MSNRALNLSWKLHKLNFYTVHYSQYACISNSHKTHPWIFNTEFLMNISKILPQPCLKYSTFFEKSIIQNCSTNFFYSFFCCNEILWQKIVGTKFNSLTIPYHLLSSKGVSKDSKHDRNVQAAADSEARDGLSHLIC